MENNGKHVRENKRMTDKESERDVSLKKVSMPGFL